MSINTKTAFDKIQLSFIIKAVNRLSVGVSYPNIIKAVYDKPKGNIILNVRRLKAFTLRSGTRQGCPFSPLLFSIAQEVLPSAIVQKKEIQWILRS
jgi:hypothetical protein